MKELSVSDLIVTCAKVPSFSTFEERIHPLIEELCSDVAQVEISYVPANNMVIYVPGNRTAPPVAITAHIDKINHFAKGHTDSLPANVENGRIEGMMDDAAGVGMCLAMVRKSQEHNFPPLYILLSEVEEGTDIMERSDWLKNGGEGIYSGIGAMRISKYLIENNIFPAAIITLDTTPIFKGEPGIALYNKFWHMEKTYIPTQKLLDKTQRIESFFTEINPEILVSNANNDYRGYGKMFNLIEQTDTPSIAIEPAIYPYHKADEGVFVKDVEKIVEMLTQFLEEFDFSSYLAS
ncbi:MAG: hypothetical protein R3E32_11715 [Chitinophagales bacterium]